MVAQVFKTTNQPKSNASKFAIDQNKKNFNMARDYASFRPLSKIPTKIRVLSPCQN
jgi:hypothetical protein